MKLSAQEEIPLARTQELSSLEGNERAQASLKLLDELEQSLKDGENALLSRDVAALERHTAEQRRLSQFLETLLLPDGAVPCGAGERPKSRYVPQPTSALYAAALHAAKLRVLHRTRVQAALLGRAQRFLAVLYNLTAGPGATYGTLLSRMNEIAGPAHRSAAQKKLPCRV